MNCCRLLLLLFITVAGANSGHYINQFAVKLKEGGRDIADLLALSHGFVVKRELPNIGVFLLEHPDVDQRSKRSIDDLVQRLRGDARVAHAEQEFELIRKKRVIIHDKQLEMPLRKIENDSLFSRFTPPMERDNINVNVVTFSDPKFKDMWYLMNLGQSGGEMGLDMNMPLVWRSGHTGKGVVVCILDDGIDHHHPDLVDNFDSKASTDLNDLSDKREDPMPDKSDKENSHGTRCAGEIASAANNGVCGVGVAYESRIGGVRILDGTITDSLEAEALTFSNNYIHIYSASWGPRDDGATMEGPLKLALQALKDGVEKGRNGLGSIFVWATGNGGMNSDDCSADGYVSAPETLSVGSVTDRGTSPYFMENCTSTLAVVPSGGEEYQGQEDYEGKVKLKVVTTDMGGGCVENFQGTSSAAPLAAGCLANVLQANPNLSWRDVQHIVVQGSRIPSADTSWTINGAGHHVSRRFGFGLMDCAHMVQLAQGWNSVPAQRKCSHHQEDHQIIQRSGVVSASIQTEGCRDNDSESIDRLEHVQVRVKMTTNRRGDTRIVLTSPTGTQSELLSPRINDDFQGEWEFTFMTVHHWDESPQGKWTLEIHNVPSGPDRHDDLSGSVELEELSHKEKVEYLIHLLDNMKSPTDYISEWELIFLGTHGSRHDRTMSKANRNQHAFTPSESYIATLKQKEVDLSKRVKVKRAKVSKSVGEEVRQDGPGESDSDEKELMEKLWALLSLHGANKVRKRVLNDEQSRDEVTTGHSAKISGSASQLLDEMLSLVKKRLEKKQVREDKVKKKVMNPVDKLLSYLERKLK